MVEINSRVAPVASVVLAAFALASLYIFSSSSPENALSAPFEADKARLGEASDSCGLPCWEFGEMEDAVNIGHDDSF